MDNSALAAWQVYRGALSNRMFPVTVPGTYTGSFPAGFDAAPYYEAVRRQKALDERFFGKWKGADDVSGKIISVGRASVFPHNNFDVFSLVSPPNSPENKNLRVSLEFTSEDEESLALFTDIILMALKVINTRKFSLSEGP